MIFPKSESPHDVNISLIRIADENNKDIDAMQNEIKRMKGEQDEMKARYMSQKTRWDNYKDAYQATLDAYHIQNGNVSVDRMLELLPWGQL